MAKELKKIYSFDIYDTLIKRNISNPSDVFDLVEKEFNKINIDSQIMNFKEKRIIAERKCRENSSKEISINEIYDELSKIYNSQDASKLKEIEMKLEYDITVKNDDPYIINLYEKAKKEGRIIITSDMYLPYDLITSILEKCEIKDYEKLYLSSTIGCKKSNGTLFEYILDDLSVEPSLICHIGDNKNSDYMQPKSKNIEAIRYIEKNRIIKHDNINYNVFENFINNYTDNNNDYFYNYGFKFFGPLLYNFSKWIDQELKKEKIEKVFFLARDGKIMKEAFLKYKKNNDEYKNITYMYASRRAIIVPSFCEYSSINEILGSINLPKLIHLDDLLKRLGLDSYDANEITNKYSLKLDKEYVTKELIENNKEFLDELYPIVVNNSKIEKKNMLKYLKNIEFNNKVAIIDIGWFGNMQVALSKNTDANIYGYYFGLRPNKKNGIKTKGCYFDKNINEKYNYRQFSLNSIFEFMFTADHGSVKNYSADGINANLYPNEYIEENDSNAIKCMQAGALAFIEIYGKSQLDSYIEIDNDYVFERILNMLENPSLDDSYKIGFLDFVDGSKIKIAKSKGLKYYILHPKKFIYDLKHSAWKVGFLRQTFKININYNKIYKFLKK